MAAHGAFPKHFARINRKYLSPGVSTIWMCVISIVCFVTLNSVSSSILEDSVTATGLGIAFYYGLTGLACFWYYRHELGKSRSNLVMIGLLPLTGALILFVLLGYDIYLSANPSNSSVGTAWFGVGPPVAIAGLSLLRRDRADDRAADRRPRPVLPLEAGDGRSRGAPRPPGESQWLT